MRFSDMPAEQQEKSEADKIMHVSLPIGKGSVLMGSDTPISMGKVTKGTDLSVAIAADSKEEADKLFNGLSAGGQVTMPMDTAPWGDYFGMFNDKFGTQWMINFVQEQK
jgi:PhnB protein